MQIILFVLMQQLHQTPILMCLIICQNRFFKEKFSFLFLFSGVSNMFVTSVGVNNLDGKPSWKISLSDNT